MSGTPKLLMLLLDINFAVKMYEEKVSKVIGFVNKQSYKRGWFVCDFGLAKDIVLFKVFCHPNLLQMGTILSM